MTKFLTRGALHQTKIKASLIIHSILFLVMGALNQVSAQTNPLRLTPEEPNSYDYTLIIEYTPISNSMIGFDENGSPFRASRFEQNLVFSLSGSYTFSRSFSVISSASLNYGSSREVRNSYNAATTAQVLNNNISLVAGSLSFEYRPAPESQFNPRLSVGVSYPFALSIEAGVSTTLDPVTLAAIVGYTKSLDNNNSDKLQFGFEAGFLANDAIRFVTSANYTIPLDSVNLSETSVSLYTGYSLDRKGNQEVGIRFKITSTDTDTRIGLGFEFGGRGQINNSGSNSEANKPKPEIQKPVTIESIQKQLQVREAQFKQALEEIKNLRDALDALKK